MFFSWCLLQSTIQDFASFLAILTTVGIIIKPAFAFCNSLLEQPKSVSRVMWVAVNASEKRLENKIIAELKEANGALMEVIGELSKKIDNLQN